MKLVRALGKQQQVLESLLQALRISREIGDRQGESLALSYIASAYGVQGNQQQALESPQLALRISREIGFRFGEGLALFSTGSVYLAQGQRQQELESYQQALRISREIGWRFGEYQALQHLGIFHFLHGNKQQGNEFSQQASPIFRELYDQGGVVIVNAAALLFDRALKVHSAPGKKPPLQGSRTSMLVVRRVSGQLEGRLVYMAYAGMDLRTKPEPPIRISLDGKEIGTIWPPKRSVSWFEALVESPLEEERSQFEIQAGHHDLILNVPWFSAIYYMAFTGGAPGIQSFDIAPGETVTFLCQYTPATRGYMIRLQKQ